MRRRTAACLRALWIVLALCWWAAPARAGEHVNVVVILADDLGYGDLGCYGHPTFKTPNLDRMAKSGARLTSFYTPVPFCAPTRGSLMTGRYPPRNGLNGNPVPKEDFIAKNADDVGLPVSEITLAQLMRAAGYRTMCIGKWHLGHQPQFRPLQRGFDEYYGILYSNDMHRVELIEGNEVVEYPVVQATLTPRYTEHAIKFITRNKDRPFFLYLAHAMPHKPLACSERYYKTSGHGLYADVMGELDWSVGRVLDTLKDLKLDKNTLVIFTSDNGPWYGGSTGGLRGMKSQNWEGGLRVPFIAYWPGHIPAGHESHEPATTPDIFTTVLTATKVDHSKNVVLDGKNIMPLLAGKAKSPHEAIYSFRNGLVSSVRNGKWKLHVLPPTAKFKVWGPEDKYVDPRAPDGVRILAPFEQPHASLFPGVLTGDPVETMGLFDLDADRAEQKNVLAKHPDIVKNLKALADTLQAELPKVAPKKKLKTKFSGQPKAAALDDASPSGITHGPILGRPGAHEMGVWIRTAQPSEFYVRYGTDAAALTSKSASAQTILEHDCAGWVSLKNLKANTRYHYQVMLVGKDDAQAGPAGSFRTLPDPKDYFDPKVNPRGLFNFRFEVGSCANQGEHGLGPTLPLYKTMLEQKVPDKVHFAIMNGDWLYEDQRDFSPKKWLAQMGLAEPFYPVSFAPTIAGVWQNYKVYLSRGKNLAAWHRVVPSYFTFDDHEILNDVNGCGQPGLVDRRAVFRDIAVQAWYDYLGWSNPVEFTQGIHFGRTLVNLRLGKDILHDPKADFSKLDLKQVANLHIHWGTGDAGVNDEKLDKLPPRLANAGVYEIVEVLDKHRLRLKPALKVDEQIAYSIGRRSYYKWRVGNCEFFALDTRSHRMKHDIKRPDRPDVSLIGNEQKAWLMENMKKSDADFLFVVSSVPFMIPHNGAGGMAFQAEDKDDAWTVFLHERQELIQFWDKLNRPVMVLTGDLHNSFAIKITDRVWEFCCGPHNSRNHNAGSEGGRPPTGLFKSGNRTCDIRWSTYFRDDVLKENRLRPIYCIIQVNNAFNNPLDKTVERWVAYPQPQVVIQYYEGLTGEFLYAEAIRALTGKRDNLGQ